MPEVREVLVCIQSMTIVKPPTRQLPPGAASLDINQSLSHFFTMKSSCALYFNNGAEAKKVYGVVIFL